jgi:uncharacterized membrane protein
MTPQWQQMDAADRAFTGPLMMDAVLRPNRSLSSRVFVILIVAFCALNAAMAAAFLAIGAWPVIGFLGLDVALLFLAFQINYREGRAFEQVQVSPDRVQVTHTDAKGASRRWQVHPAWARIETTEEVVLVHAGGSRLPMARFLSPPERADFSAALQAAIDRARAYRPSTSSME